MKKILLVEDNELRSRLLADLLHEEGNETVIANNGKEALWILKDFSFDLIVSDLVMPLMDGFELAKAIKASKDKDTPFLIYSSRYPPDEEDIELATRIGVDQYLHAIGTAEIKEEVMKYLTNKEIKS